MNTTEHVLLIILAAALAIFLILGIATLIFVLRIVKSVNRITTKAEHLLETAENVGEVFKNAAGPLAIFRLVSNIVESVKSKRS